MLVLSRKVGEKIIIEGGITVTVLATTGSRVRLGIVAPPEVFIRRNEVAFDTSPLANLPFADSTRSSHVGNGHFQLDA